LLSSSFIAGAMSRRHPLLGNLEAKFMGKHMRTILNRLWEEEEGQDLVEYGLLLVLVSLGAVAAMGTLASAISNAFGGASSNLSSS
jgi:Flp pilus assembly pilin Flp